MLLLLIMILILVCVANFIISRRDKRIYSLRGSGSFERFSSEFEGENISKDVLLETYNQLQIWKSSRDFPVCSSDSLSGIYGIVDEDLIDVIVTILISLKVADFNKKITGFDTIITVRDLVYFVESFLS